MCHCYNSKTDNETCRLYLCLNRYILTIGIHMVSYI